MQFPWWMGTYLIFWHELLKMSGRTQSDHSEAYRYVLLLFLYGGGINLTCGPHSWSSLGIFSSYLRLPRATPSLFLLSKVRSGRNASSTRSPLHTYFGRRITVRHRLFLGFCFSQVSDGLAEFVDLLNSLRMGVASQVAVATFNGLRRPLPVIDGIVPTELFPLRKEVDNSNKMRLDELKTESQIYESRDTGAASEGRREAILKNMVVQRVLEIKVDAQVMLVKNVDDNLVNGSVGRVLGFRMVSEVCGSGGDISSKGGHGFIRNILLKDDGVTPVKRKVMKNENDNNDAKPKSKNGSLESVERFPLVEFLTPLGKEVVLVGRDEFKVEENDGTIAARRVQVSVNCVGETIIDVPV